MLVLAATPIGNLGDASARLRHALESASVIAAEDTRTASHLLRALGIESRPRLIALHEHNERARAAEVAQLARDQDVLVLSDAGMPGISDPGYDVVRAAIDAGVQVTALPGPVAAITALAISGLPTDRFAFEGFVPRKPGERRAALTALAREPRTLLFYEAPHRIRAFLTDAVAAFGADRPAVVARELTKLYEEVVRGTLASLAEWASGDVRGEIVVVIGGAPTAAADADDALAEVLSRVEGGERLKAAAADVAGATGLSQRDLYEAALRARPPRAPAS